MKVYDVTVIGAGHAGMEAAHAAWKIGAQVALVVMDIKSIGRMSCNPAIGGVGKGQMVRDIDALGGLMGKLADKAGISFRILNSSKGPAVWGNRAQCDMNLYSELAQSAMQSLKGLEIIENCAAEIERAESGNWQVLFVDGMRVQTRKLIIAGGTFLAARMFTGLDSVSIGGRVGEQSAERLAQSIRNLGLGMRRLKTGTPSRIDPVSIDFSKCEVQTGDTVPWSFSNETDVAGLCNSARCWITRTNARTHDILRQGFSQSPMFTGVIKGLGPRYCPSIEDKINRFAGKDSHQLFLEPETKDFSGGGRVYINGFSSSLPESVQIEAMHTIPGLERAKVLQIGYAVEYDAVKGTELHPTLESKKHSGLYFAGQVCGTSGYEEAAAQGIIAGINAALSLGNGNGNPFILSRADSYIGVLIDDIVSMDWNEPYRMFTSRAEYRLFLRSDNSETRLCEKARAAGMLTDAQWERYTKECERLASARSYLHENSGSPQEIAPLLAESGQAPILERTKWINVLRRPCISAEDFFHAVDVGVSLTRREKWHLLAEELYRGFFERQAEEIAWQKKMSGMKIPQDFDYSKAIALSIEARQKLSESMPLTIGAAARVSGVRAGDITVLRHILAGESRPQRTCNQEP